MMNKLPVDIGSGGTQGGMENTMKDKQLKASHHGRTVYGRAYFPDSDKRYPTVIISHGFNGDMDVFDSTARRFAQNGIGAVCYTFCGGSTRDSSGFASTEMTVFTEKEDLLAVIDTISDWECVDRENIFLFGESMGGLVSALTAKEIGSSIRGLILYYPALCVADDWRKHFPKVEDIPDEHELWGLKLGRCFFESIHDFDVFEAIKGYKNNVLILHGEEDAVVPVDYSKKAAKLYENARLELFEHEGHGFSQESSDRMEELALEFFRNNIV